MRILLAQRSKSAPPDPVDVQVARLAARQHGVVSRKQLRELLSSPAISRRIAAGLLHPLHAGVYAIGHPLTTREGRYMAAVLACGDGALLSHRCVANLLGLLPPGSGPIDVTVSLSGSRPRPGIRVHVTRTLVDDDVTVCERIPCTSLARTLVDLAGVVPPRTLRRALEQALVLRIFDRVPLDAALERANGRRGTGTLRRLLAKLTYEPPFTRSELERLFLDLVRQAGLPGPVVNGLVAGHEVDFHWPTLRLVVETDGGATHANPLAFERDRQRDLDLELAGWHVLRVSWRQVVEEPHRVTAILRAWLG